MAVLRARKGKGEGEVFGVADSTIPTLIGRDPDAQITLDDDRASRRHARVFRQAGRWIVQDLGSSNGTLLAGEAIDKSVISDGDLLQIGHHLFVFDASSHPPPGTPEVYGTRLEKVLHEESGVTAYEGWQSAMDRQVRIDLLKPDWPLPDAALTLVREAIEGASRLRQPGIAPLIDFRLESSCELKYVVSRPGPGTLLVDPLEELREWPLGDRIALLGDLARALFARAERVQVTPLSLPQIQVAAADEGPRCTILALDFQALISLATGNYLHLPAYAQTLAPETIRRDGARHFDLASQCYSLGALSYWVLCGSPPMGTAPHGKLLEHHRKQRPAPPELLEPAIPPELARLVLAQLEKDPKSRPPPDEIESALRAHAAERGAEGPARPPSRRDLAPVEPTASPRAPGRERSVPTSEPSAPPPPRPAVERPRVAFWGRAAALPLWASLWILLFWSARVAARLLATGP